MKIENILYLSKLSEPCIIFGKICFIIDSFSDIVYLQKYCYAPPPYRLVCEKSLVAVENLNFVVVSGLKKGATVSWGQRQVQTEMFYDKNCENELC